jgi:hypothetical protein
MRGSDWSAVKREHVIEACRRYDAGEKPARDAISTFLIHEGKEYPAKFIRGLAYKIATGRAITSEDYTGGSETAVFLRGLGFEVRYEPRNPAIAVATPEKRRIREKPLDRRSQKNALQKLLQKRLGHMESEKTFPLLRTPSSASESSDYKKIIEALTNIDGNAGFIKWNYPLACDFYFEDFKLIVEYDELNHFTLARKLTLENYPKNVNLGFSLEKWIEACDRIHSVDNYPPGRDKGRAFFDAVRDIEALRHGYSLIRIKHRDVDWEQPDGGKNLDDLLRRQNVFSENQLSPSPKKNEEIKLEDTEKQISMEGNGSGSIRVGRVIMNMLVKMSELKAYSNKWFGQKQILFGQFHENPERYIARVRNLVEMGLSEKVDVLLMPACAFVFDKNHPGQKYEELIRKIPFTIAGGLDFDQIDNSGKDNDFKEWLMLFHHGEMFDRCGKSKIPWFKVNKFSVMTAVSSTIKDIKQDIYTPIEAFPPDKESPILVLDAGHFQYAFRYILTMKSVQRYVNTLAERSWVILSYWKYSGGKSNYYWLEPKEDLDGIVQIERKSLPITNSRGEDDIIDVIDIHI